MIRDVEANMKVIKSAVSVSSVLKSIVNIRNSTHTPLLEEVEIIGTSVIPSRIRNVAMIRTKSKQLEERLF